MNAAWFATALWVSSFRDWILIRWNGWRQYVLTGQVNDGNAWYAGRGVSWCGGHLLPLEDIQLLLDMLMHDGMVDGKPF